MISLKADIGTRNLLKAIFKAEIHICYLESIRKNGKALTVVYTYTDDIRQVDNIYAFCPILHCKSRIVFLNNKFRAPMISLKADIGTRNLLEALFKAEIHICYLESISKKGKALTVVYTYTDDIRQVIEAVGVPRYDVPQIHMGNHLDRGSRCNSSHANMSAPASIPSRPHAQQPPRPARTEQSLPHRGVQPRPAPAEQVCGVIEPPG
jgi:hypothetical protein